MRFGIEPVGVDQGREQQAQEEFADERVLHGLWRQARGSLRLKFRDGSRRVLERVAAGLFPSWIV